MEMTVDELLVLTCSTCIEFWNLYVALIHLIMFRHPDYHVITELHQYLYGVIDKLPKYKMNL